MIRNGRNLDKTAMEAYWLALNDQLEREVTVLPKTVKELQAQILGLEERLRGVPNGDALIALAVDNGLGNPGEIRRLLAAYKEQTGREKPKFME